MADPNDAQLLHELVQNADAQNPDPSLATTLLRPRVNWRDINLQMQAANFAKQNGVYTVGQVSNVSSTPDPDLYVLGVIAGLALLALAL